MALRELSTAFRPRACFNFEPWRRLPTHRWHLGRDGHKHAFRRVASEVRNMLFFATLESCSCYHLYFRLNPWSNLLPWMSAHNNFKDVIRNSNFWFICSSRVEMGQQLVFVTSHHDCACVRLSLHKLGAIYSYVSLLGMVDSSFLANATLNANSAVDRVCFGCRTPSDTLDRSGRFPLDMCSICPVNSVLKYGIVSSSKFLSHHFLTKLRSHASWRVRPTFRHVFMFDSFNWASFWCFPLDCGLAENMLPPMRRRGTMSNWGWAFAHDTIISFWEIRQNIWGGGVGGSSIPIRTGVSDLFFVSDAFRKFLFELICRLFCWFSAQQCSLLESKYWEKSCQKSFIGTFCSSSYSQLRAYCLACCGLSWGGVLYKRSVYNEVLSCSQFCVTLWRYNHVVSIHVFCSFPRSFAVQESNTSWHRYWSGVHREWLLLFVAFGFVFFLDMM